MNCLSYENACGTIFEILIKKFLNFEKVDLRIFLLENVSELPIRFSAN